MELLVNVNDGERGLSPAPVVQDISFRALRHYVDP